MPTAGRLVGAIMTALAGIVLAYLSSARFEFSVPNYWWPACIAIGCIVGWRFLGGRQTLKISHGISQGVGAIVLLVFWAFFVMSFADMITTAMRGRYDTPIEAILAIFQLLISNLGQYMTVFTTIVLLILALFAGVVTTVANRMTQLK